MVVLSGASASIQVIQKGQGIDDATFSVVAALLLSISPKSAMKSFSLWLAF